MARLLGPTPWARTALAPHRAEIAEGPEVWVAVTSTGGATGPWTVRVWSDPAARPAVELFHHYGSAIHAYRVAIARLPDVVRWRDTDVEVVA